MLRLNKTQTTRQATRLRPTARVVDSICNIRPESVPYIGEVGGWGQGDIVLSRQGAFGTVVHT